MPKIQAVTDEMKAIADRIGENVSAMVDSQSSVKNCIGSILVHFGSNPRVMSALHLSNVTLGYRNVGESLTGYQEFLVNAANTYEWNDEQMAKWGDVMQNEKGVDIHNYTSPNAVPEGGWNVSDGWNSVESSFPNTRPNLDSKYYNVYVDANKYIRDGWYAEHKSTKQYDINGIKHINCLSYARQRALEVNQLDTYTAYPNSGSGTEIRSNSVAYFHNSSGFVHAAYVEYYDEATQTVYFTEGNWGDRPDGELKTMSLDEFNSRGSSDNKWTVANYDYYPPE